jgi:hypothetical protein
MPTTLTDHVLPNTLKNNCSECNQEVWTSPGTIIRVNLYGYKIICINCVMKYKGIALIELPSCEELHVTIKRIAEQN